MMRMGSFAFKTRMARISKVGMSCSQGNLEPPITAGMAYTVVIVAAQGNLYVCDLLEGAKCK